MKKLFGLSLVCIIIIAGCKNGSNSNSNPGGYSISGIVTGKDSGWVYLRHKDSTGTVEDSARIKDHKFVFMGKVAEPSLFYFMLGNGDDDKYLTFFGEDTSIQITADKDSVDKATVSGSASQALYEAYTKMMKPLKMQEREVDKEYKAAYDNKDKALMDSLDKVGSKIDTEEHQAILSYIQSNPSSIIGAWAVSRNMLYDPDIAVLKKTLATFTPAVQQSSYGKMIGQTIEMTEKFAVGKTAPDFTMNDTAGKPVSLSSFKGKYVLVDFWASWCGPCRRENPNVVAAFEKYKGKSFTILGVSLDDDKASWLKAISKDNLAWTQVSDLKGWKNAVSVQYGIRAIPSNFLLDPDGKIIGHNLRGDELAGVLAKTLD